MSKLAPTAETLALIGMILLSVAWWSGLRADDTPKGCDCPYCGTKDVKFENTPEGAFQRMKFAIATANVDLLRECSVGLTDEMAADIRKKAKPDPNAARIVVKSCKIDGDKAVVTTDLDGSETVLPAVRDGGTWKIDMTAIKEAARVRSDDLDCANNLRQLGTYIVIYVSRYGNDRNYSGPGQKLFSDLFTLPSPERAIASGNEGILICRKSAAKDALEQLKKGNFDAMSYECTEEKIFDGETQPQWPIAWDKTPCHDGKRNVLFFSGSVSPMSEEELQAARKHGK